MHTPRIDIVEKKLLSDNHYRLERITFDYEKPDGTVERQYREAYDRGNGAAILLYNVANRTIILTRQFRMPTYLNGNPTGMMIEACAGLLEEDDPAECIRREAIEETGYEVREVRKVYETYMSPGSVTEILHLFIGEYLPEMKKGDGGGLESEHENIEVLELPFQRAMEMVENGDIRDAKTILLLQYAEMKKLFDQ
ncbi:MAG TPA: GDP-mannose pyrophosphatase NudK [Flavobacterium sp.]|nr:GDP-mannose pyrophosphatase NudK [Flavobacterium sp.]